MQNSNYSPQTATWRLGNMVTIENTTQNNYLLIIKDKRADLVKIEISHHTLENLIRAGLRAISPNITLKNPKLKLEQY